MKVLLATDGKRPAIGAQKLLAGIGDRDRIEITVMSVADFDAAVQEGERTEGRFSPEAGRNMPWRSLIVPSKNWRSSSREQRTGSGSR